MISQLALRWALTALFAVTAALFAAAARRERPAFNALHALASAAMILMIWPAGMSVSPLVYLLVFSGATLYLAYLALFGDRLPHPIYHCTMMAAMAVMGLLMAPNTAMPTMAGGSPMHMSHLPMAMPAHAMAPSPLWLTAVTTMLAAGFGIAALWWFYLLVRGPQRPYAYLLMALGMSAAFAAMAV